jgi:hypothetical protein
MTETKRWIGGIRTVRPPALWDDIERRVHQDETSREPSRRRPMLAAVLLLGAVAIVGSTLYALRSLGSGSLVASPAPGEIIRYRVDGAPQPLAVGEGAAWVDVTTMSPRGTGPSTIWRIDARTGEAKPLPATTGAVWVVPGKEGVWATCNAVACGGPGVLQLDPATGDLIRTVALDDRTSQLAVGLGSVWVSTESGLVKIDAGSGSVVATFPGSYNFLGVDGGSLWATTPQGLAELDPSSGKPLRQFPFPDPCYLDVNPTIVFVATCGGATISHDVLEAVDTQTGRVLYRVPLDGWGSMRLSDQTLVIVQHDPTSPGFIRLVQLDAATGKSLGPPFEVRGDDARFSMEALVEPNPFLAVGEGSAWFTDFGAGEVIRVGLPISGSGMPTPSPPSAAPPSPSDTSGTQDQGARAAAIAESERLLGLTPTPPGAAPTTSAPVPALHHPSQTPATSYLIDRSTWWTVPMSATATMAWIRTHPPSGLRRTTSGSGVGANGPFADVGFEDEPSGSFTSATLLIEVVPTGPGTSAIRVDGQTIWLPPRPAATLVPPDPAQASLVAYHGSPTDVLDQRTLTGVEANDLATLINGLPVDTGGAYNCAEGTGPRFQVTFPTANGPLVFTEIPECFSVSVTLDGASELPLRDDAGLARVLRTKLGLPANA